MSYLTFHLIFLAPPIAAMLFMHRRPRHLDADVRVDLTIPLICVVALTYTTPWDNYLVAKGIWGYGPGRVVGTIGYVPVEEYLFFVLQPLLTALFLYQYLDRFARAPIASSVNASWIGAGVFLGLTGLGTAFLVDGSPSTLYLALLLTWASPLLAGMWLYDGETLWALRSTVFVTTAVPTLYLWVADAIAIQFQIWTISSTHTLGISAFGLPLEEATFFSLANLLVVQGVILLLYGSHEVATPEESAS